MADRPGSDVELRVMRDGAVAFGPVQAMLLEEILLSGSISGAQRRLGFGYVYTWKLVAAMNDRFTPPLVEVSRGGNRGGGARLILQGQQILIAYRRMERILLAAGCAELYVINNGLRPADRAAANRARP